ncbi:MAG: dihydroorotate dehydrogenase [Synergistales bacterium]
MTSERRSSRVSVGHVFLDSPLIIASGTWPHEAGFWKAPVCSGASAACTKALTLHAREGNPGIRLWETPCGLLNSIGLQNQGIDRFLSEDLPKISAKDLKVIANVAMETEEETEAVLSRLSRFSELLAAVELNISCPNVDAGGMAWGSDPRQAARAIRLARQNWKGPLWAKLTPQCAEISLVAKASEEAGADALVVANTWLGMAIDTSSEKPVFKRCVAGLSGPAVFPLALRLVWEVSSSVGIPVIGCGGISKSDDVISMMLAGASAVEIGTLHFADLSCFRKLQEGILEHLAAKGYSSPMELIGRGKRKDV